MYAICSVRTQAARELCDDSGDLARNSIPTDALRGQAMYARGVEDMLRCWTRVQASEGQVGNCRNEEIVGTREYVVEMKG